jgi:hypothetical protein
VDDNFAEQFQSMVFADSGENRVNGLNMVNRRTSSNEKETLEDIGSFYSRHWMRPGGEENEEKPSSFQARTPG